VLLNATAATAATIHLMATVANNRSGCIIVRELNHAVVFITESWRESNDRLCGVTYTHIHGWIGARAVGVCINHRR